MALIHFVHGEKGGVGKSFFARILVEYCLDKGLDFTLIEADRNNPDVGSLYPELCEQVLFSPVEKRCNEADLIFNLSLHQPVIVNLPSGIESLLSQWIERNGLVGGEFSSKYNVLLYKWFVCTGEPYSVQFFKNSVNAFSGQISHVLVKNFLYERNWQRWNNDPELGAFLKEKGVKELILPELHKKYADLIVFDKRPFAELVSNSSGLLRSSRQMLVNYLRRVYEAIEATELMTPEMFLSHGF